MFLPLSELARKYSYNLDWGMHYVEHCTLGSGADRCQTINLHKHIPQTLDQALTCAPEGCAPPDDAPAAAAPPAGASRSLSIDEVVLLRRMLPLLPASPVHTETHIHLSAWMLHALPALHAACM